MKGMPDLKETTTSLTDFIETILEETLDHSDFSDLTSRQLHSIKS